ncbi:MAG TPA: 4Fe-4S cluster-binding domain-containing protein, partial [Clostridia bacterium]|nr:4Fe-4S cluster-binding domain-containing protein [Clostridia bacterium]
MTQASEQSMTARGPDESAIGRLHSIETFGTVDGPGIRVVLFFQGCPLRCAYCHNRDTWDAAGGRAWTVNELKDFVLRYRPYMESSGGGVTATG